MPPRRPLACAVLTVGLLAACSDGGPTTATPTAGGPAPAPASAAPSASATAPDAAPEIEGLEVLAEDLSHDHQQGRIAYDRVPPLGGPHKPRWLACGVYDEAVPDEFAVHSIEHGAVWLAHAPDLPAGEVTQLAELAESNREYVLVAPRDGLDSRIVVVTWGATIEASSADDPRLAEFVQAYAGGGQGGEPGAPCATGGLTPDQARAQLGG